MVVSTDDPAIAEVARRWQAETVARPPAISGDSASFESALLHCLDHLEQTEHYVPELVVFLQATAPLTLSGDIEATVAQLVATGADTALAVSDFHYFLWRQDDDGRAIGINHRPAVRLLRQQQPANYLECGAVYVMRTAGLRAAKHRFFGKTVVHVMPRDRCWEIDDPVDLEVAEVLLRRRQRSRRAAQIPQPLAAIVLDFDGVLTDNRALVLQDGSEAVACNRSDGLAIARLRQAGIEMLVLSSETNPVVRARCAKLGIASRQGIAQKWPVLCAWLAEKGLDPQETIYVGNDVNDIACLRNTGCGIAPADAHRQARAAARVVLDARGGHGAIRELAELVTERLGDGCHARSA